MIIDPYIKIRVFENVYHPSDDSYLLLSAIKIDGRKKALDMGCGSGIIALHMAKSGNDVVAADISKPAIKNTIFNAGLNNLKIDTIQSNLFKNIKEKYDIIVFNPPYLPTINEDISWDGGIKGLNIIQPFLETAKKHLFKNGVIYIVISNLTDMKKMIADNSAEYNFEVISYKRIFFECLYVYRIILKKKLKSS